MGLSGDCVCVLSVAYFHSQEKYLITHCVFQGFQLELTHLSHSVPAQVI